MDWLSNSIFLLLVFIVSTPVYTQNIEFKDPVPEEFRTSTQSNNPTPQKNKAQISGQNKVLHANDIKRQPQQSMVEKMGAPYYPPNATAEEKREITKQHVQAQMKTNNPTSDNNFRQGNYEELARKEMGYLLNENYQNNQKLKNSNHKVSPNYYKDRQNYERAKKEIKDQLTGRKPVSIKDAYFYAESAYGNLQLDYEEYNQTIEKNKQFILAWLKQIGKDVTDPEALHYGIQSFSSDTLYLKVNDPDDVFGGSHTVMHLPFSYDYVDYSSTKDRRNYFITKTLATGTGQCHTLPVNYLVTAEALGVDASLSFNPDHSFIQYRNNKGTLLNFETTIGRHMPDQVYMDMMPTMARAHHNNVFVNELSKKQLLSTILIDLSVNFLFEHWFADEEIVNDCILTAEKYFPNREYINTSSMWIKKKCLTQQLNRMVEGKGITDLSEIKKHPEINAAYLRLKNYLERLQKLGIEPFPEDEYIRMMAYHDKNERLQISKNIDTKSKRDLFIRK